VKELFGNQSSKSLITKRDELDARSSSSEASVRRSDMTTSGVPVQNVNCRHHTTGSCDCDRYFARPGTAEYGC
jgi:hypothetical protein